MLCSSHPLQWLRAHEFGPLSGNDARVKDLLEALIMLTAFCLRHWNRGKQTAQHVRSGIQCSYAVIGLIDVMSRKFR